MERAAGGDTIKFAGQRFEPLAPNAFAVSFSKRKLAETRELLKQAQHESRNQKHGSNASGTTTSTAI
jgi:hypothetical protein